MHLRTLLNRVCRYKGFVIGTERLTPYDTVEIEVRPRANSRPICSCCHRPGTTYDHLKERRFEMIPIWTMSVILLYTMRRVDCPICGVKVEEVPWAIGKSSLTKAFAHHLAGWARYISWKEVAARFGVCWDKVGQAVKWLVDYGMEHRSLEGITAIGVDEIAIGKGHKYLTLVYQIDSTCRRLLWVGKERTMESFHAFFDMLGERRCSLINFVCSDMWRAYLQVIAERLPKALNILDRFHIVKHLNDAIDETRRAEVTKLRAKKMPAHLKGSRWVWLKRIANLTRNQRAHLRTLLQINLTTVKAYLLKESFDKLWSYVSPTWAGKFLDGWCREVMRHRSLPHMKKFVGTLRRHRDLILNYFRAKTRTGDTFSSGIVEGFNLKAKLCFRKSYGFRSHEYREVALLHVLGNLPEPEATHRFG